MCPNSSNRINGINDILLGSPESRLFTSLNVLKTDETVDRAGRHVVGERSNT